MKMMIIVDRPLDRIYLWAIINRKCNIFSKIILIEGSIFNIPILTVLVFLDMISCDQCDM